MIAIATDRMSIADPRRVDGDALAAGALDTSAMARVALSAPPLDAANRDSTQRGTPRRPHPVFHWG